MCVCVVCGVCVFYVGTTVILNGAILGYAAEEKLASIAEKLRFLKVEDNSGVPKELEIVVVPLERGSLFPGLYLFSTPARMLRPVRYLATGDAELLGSFEQV